MLEEQERQQVLDLGKEIEQMDLPDKFKAILFTRLLDRVMGGTLSTEEHFDNRGKKATHNDPIGELSSAAGVNQNCLETLYDFEDDQAVVIIEARKLQGSNADKQRTLALVHLIAQFDGYKKDAVSAAEVRELCRHYGVYDSSFSTNINSHKNYFRSTVKKGSSGGEYKLTAPGRSAAYELLKNMCSGHE